MLYVKHVTPASTPDVYFQGNPLVEVLFANAPDALFILDGVNYSILDCNAKALDLFEVESKASLLNLPSFRLYESEFTDLSQELLEKNISNLGEHTQEMAFRSFRQNVFWGKLVKRTVKMDGKTYVVLRVSRSVDYLRAEEVMSNLLHGTAHVTGMKYFKELTRLLCKTFDVPISFVGKLSNDKTKMEIVGAYGPVDPNLPQVFTVKWSLVENTTRGYTSFYPRGARELFPNDPFTQSHQIEGFMCAPIYGTAGDVIGVMGIASDKMMDEIPNSRHILSFFALRTAAEFHRIRSKNLLKDQATKLSEANHIKDKLLSVISHDLMNPLHSVMGYSELLQQKKDTYSKEEMLERVELIDNSIKNIYFLLENIKGWSNIYNNRIKPVSNQVSLAKIIQENMELFKYILSLKKLRIHIDLPEENILHTDKHMLGVIVRNLLSNAIKYTPKGGSILISVTELHDQIQLKIQDDGIGIVPGEGSGSDIHNREKMTASGMGLMLAQKYTQWLDGQFTMHSMQEQGTTCMVSFTKNK